MLEDPSDYGANCIQSGNNPVFARLFSQERRPGEFNYCLNAVYPQSKLSVWIFAAGQDVVKSDAETAKYSRVNPASPGLRLYLHCADTLERRRDIMLEYLGDYGAKYVQNGNHPVFARLFSRQGGRASVTIALTMSARNRSYQLRHCRPALCRPVKWRAGMQLSYRPRVNKGR